jgi:hypothetical protein
MKMLTPSTQVEAVANTFTEILVEWLGVETMISVATANATNDGSCASHDHCDANMAMHKAMCEVVHDPLAGDEMSDSDVALWNAAWDRAREIWTASRPAWESQKDLASL